MPRSRRAGPDLQRREREEALLSPRPARDELTGIQQPLEGEGASLSPAPPWPGPQGLPLAALPSS